MAVATEKDAGVPNSVLEVPLINQLSNPVVQDRLSRVTRANDNTMAHQARS
jgi:hypothetical protein